MAAIAKFCFEIYIFWLLNQSSVRFYWFMSGSLHFSLLIFWSKWPKNKESAIIFKQNADFFIQKINKQDSWFFFPSWSLWPKNKKWNEPDIRMQKRSHNFRTKLYKIDHCAWQRVIISKTCRKSNSELFTYHIFFHQTSHSHYLRKSCNKVKKINKFLLQVQYISGQ